MAGMGRPKRLGQSKYDYVTDEETEHIVRLLAAGRSTPDVAALSGYSVEQVRDIRAAYFPTTGLATAYLRSNTLRLAKRIVEEANVEESLDVLSRPNIGVLDPAVKGGQAAAPTAILTSINPTHLGGVQVAVVSGAVGLPQETTHAELPSAATWSPPFEDRTPEPEPAPVRQLPAPQPESPRPRPGPARQPRQGHGGGQGQRRRRVLTPPPAPKKPAPRSAPRSRKPQPKPKKRTR